MNIKDFDKHIEPKILLRGLDYFKRKYIISLENDGEGEWNAEVSGSEDYDYTVTTEVSESGDILSSSCDCPYDFGVYCKHQAAVFYAICEQINLNEGNKKPRSKAGIKFEDILNKIGKDELISFLIKYAAENKKFKNEFMLNFADKFVKKSDVIFYARSLIKSSFTGLVRDGYIEYKDRPKAVKGSEKVLQMAHEETNLFTALNLCIIVIEEMLNASCKYPDAYQIYETAQEAAQLTGEIFSKYSEDSSDFIKAVDFVFSHVSDDGIYGGFSDLRIDILEIFAPMCNIKYVREKLDEYLDNWLRKVSGTYASKNSIMGGRMILLGNRPSLSHIEKSIQELQYGIISTFDGEEAARKFINSHTENDKFRSLAIEYAVSEKDYGKAIDLCLDGEKEDINHHGLLNKWKKLRYDIYDYTGNTTEQKKLAYEFTLNGDFDFYIKLRKLYATDSETSDEFFDVFENILSAAKKTYSQGIYTKILIYEKMTPELLEYCREHIYSITEFYRHLLPDYEDEVNEIFLEYLHRQASQASDRSQYRTVCDIIKEYAKACGHINADKIIESFKANYVKRPAFMDELKKIKLPGK